MTLMEMVIHTVVFSADTMQSFRWVPMLQSKILPPSPSGRRQYVFPNESTHLKDCKVSEPRISQHESSWPRKPQILEKRVWLYYKMEMMVEEAFIAYYEEWYWLGWHTSSQLPFNWKCFVTELQLNHVFLRLTSTLCNVLMICVCIHKCTQKNIPINSLYVFTTCIRRHAGLSVLFSTQCCLFHNFISFCSNNLHFFITMYQNLNTHPPRTNDMMTMHFLKWCLHKGSEAPVIWQPHLCTLGRIRNHAMF